MTKPEELLLTDGALNYRMRELKERNLMPYRYEVSNGLQMLHAIGITHVYEYADPQIKVIEQQWQRFIEEASVPHIVITEGGLREVQGDRESAVTKDGEAGLMSYLAAKYDIENISPEPDRQYEISELVKEFSKEEVMCYYFTRYVVQWAFKNHERPFDFEGYINKGVIKYYKDLLGWKDFEFTLANFKSLFERVTDKKFKLPTVSEDGKVLHWNTSTGPKKVETASCRIRDINILNEVKKEWSNGKSIFMVFGATHVVALEPAIKELLDNEK